MVIARWLERLAPLGIGLIAAGLGIWRLMPGVGFWDTAEFQTIPPILGTAHPTGYPTYVILGWLASMALAPIGEAAVRMNLLSALLVGVAAAITVDLARILTRSTLLGVVAGLGFAATPIVLAIGTHADPHALHVAFVAALLWLLVRWERARRNEPSRSDRWLVAAAAMTGLSIGNHSLTLLLALPIGLYVLAVEPEILTRSRLVAMCAVALIIPTVLVYAELPLRGGAIPALQADLVYGRPNTWSGFAYVVTGEQFRGGLNDPFGNLPGKLADVAGLAIREFGPLALIIPSGLVVTASRFPAYALLTGTAVFITSFFNAAYVNADIQRYYLGPVLIVWTWLAILAVAFIERFAEHFAPARRPTVGRQGVFATFLACVILLGPPLAVLPARAEAVDRSGDRAAQLWLDAVLDELQPNAIVVSWWSYSTPLWYAQEIEGRRRDVFVADDRTRLDLNLGGLTDVIDANLGSRPVYVIRLDTQELAQLQARYLLTPLGSPLAPNVLRVTSRAAAGYRP